MKPGRRAARQNGRPEGARHWRLRSTGDGLVVAAKGVRGGDHDGRPQSAKGHAGHDIEQAARRLKLAAPAAPAEWQRPLAAAGSSRISSTRCPDCQKSMYGEMVVRDGNHHLSVALLMRR